MTFKQTYELARKNAIDPLKLYVSSSVLDTEIGKESSDVFEAICNLVFWIYLDLDASLDDVINRVIQLYHSGVKLEDITKQKVREIL